MTIKKYIRAILLVALITIALGGFMLHYRIHPIAQNPSFLVPFFSGILSIIIVPLLFLFPKTIGYGYVLNGFLTLIGTVVMTHFSLTRWPTPATLQTVLFKTLLATYSSCGASSSSEKPFSIWKPSAMTKTSGKWG